MTDEKEKQISTIIIMVIVLICILFAGLVAFGYMSGSPDSNGFNGSTGTSGSPTTGRVAGTVFYSDGVTPLILNNPANGTDVQLFNISAGTVTSIFVTDSTGNFTSPEVPAGEYLLYGYYNNNYIGDVPVTVTANSTVQENLTTSRMPTNKS